MKSDLKEVSLDHPVLLTTATNDSAFWPKPQTAAHEKGCYTESMDDKSTGIFAQFSADACNDDGDRKPNWSDDGHNCPLKRKDGGRPENIWVLTAAKLYTHMNGAEDSKCLFSNVFVHRAGSGGLRPGPAPGRARTRPRPGRIETKN